MEPFAIHISDADLADLKCRLAGTRWTDDFANEDWCYGANAREVRELVEYWRDHYPWREREQMMNGLPQFRTTIAGQAIHLIHVKGIGKKPTPIILSHGWPWTFWDYHKVIGPLSEPTSYGGDPEDAFDVVLPLLPAELTVPTRRWAQRYYNLQRWQVFPEGGHFAPMEIPTLLVEDIRVFFRGRE